MNEVTEKIISFYENLTPENLNQIDTFYANDCYFRDPFHELKSIHDLTFLYSKMFKKLKNPKFKITNYFYKQNEMVLFWEFTCNNNFKISGNSHLILNSENKVKIHLDYWDSINEIWLKLPIIGPIIKFFYNLMFKF